MKRRKKKTLSHLIRRKIKAADLKKPELQPFRTVASGQLFGPTQIASPAS